MLPRGLLALRSYGKWPYPDLGTPQFFDCRPILPKTNARRKTTMSFSLIAPENYTGQSGRNYKVERVNLFPSTSCLPCKVGCYLRIYYFSHHQMLTPFSSAGDRKFVLKYIHPVNFEGLQDVNNKLHGANHVRLAQDIIPEKSMFEFEYFTDNLLRLAQKDLALGVRKNILKDALRAIAELHDQDIVHTEVSSESDGIIIERAQLGDLEDAAYLPPGSHMIGKQAGNWMWRSPEAHARGPVNKPSDIFSFALVCIYAMHKRVIFAVGEEELDEGVDRLAIVIERQISYFADEDGLKDFMKQLLGSDNPWVHVFEVTRDGFNQDTPRKPFSLWKDVDDDFKSLVGAMTNFNPERRITAREALAHKWFEGV